MAREYDKILMVRPSRLKDRPGNTKQHTEDQIAKLCNAINGLGFNDPIECDKHGYIMAGHGRKQAAIRLGLDKVPVIYKDMEGDEADAYAIAHNSTTLATGMSMDRAVEQMAQAGLDADDAILAGISNAEWSMYTPNTREDEAVARASSPCTPVQQPRTASPDRVRKVILRFATEDEYQEFMQMVTWMRNTFPSADTMVERFQRMKDLDRAR